MPNSRNLLIVAATAACLASQAVGQDAPPRGALSLSGVTAYTPSELLTYAAQYAHDLDGRIDPSRVAQAIELIYREDGYLLAEAHVGPDGRTVRVDEGRISALSIEGVEDPHFKALRKLFEPLLSQQPVTQKSFERAVMLAEDIPDVAVTVEIDYPPQLVGARLRVLAEKGAWQAGSFTLDNPPRELGDALSGYLVQEFYSALATGDLLRFQGSLTGYRGDSNDYSVQGALIYRTAQAASGLYGEFYLGNADARRDFRGNFVRTDLDGLFGVAALGYPIQRGIDHYGYGLIEYRYSESESVAPGEPFLSKADVLSATYLFGKNYQSGAALEVGASLSFGNPGDQALDPSIDDGDDSFWHLRAGLGYESPLSALSENTAWRTEIWGQYTNSRLPSVEKYYLGDRYSLRGYLFDEADADSGITGVFELSHSFFPANSVAMRISPFGFVDMGYLDNNTPAAGQLGSLSLASTGVGLDIGFRNNFQLSGYVAVPLRDGPFTKSGDTAGYLSLSKTW